MAALITALTATSLAPSTAAAQQTVSSQCWTDAQLADKASDHRVRTHISQAYVPRPQGHVAGAPIALPDLAGRAIRRVDLPKGVKRIALTFDLCEQPHEVAGYQGDIVDFLRANDIKATFFAGGKWLMTHVDRGSQIIGDPLFEVGNHGWEHRNQQVLTGKQIEQELDGASLAYTKIRNGLKRRACLDRSGQKLAHQNAARHQTLFRFPYGACSNEALQVAADRSLLAIQWDVSSGDPSPLISSRRMVSSVMRRVRPGSIVLFHANGRGHKTEKALPQIVKRLRAQGYEFVTVSELLSTQGAKVVTSRTCFDSRPGDTDRYKGLARRMERLYQRFYRRHRK